ncbi:zinc finger protein 721-like [Mytilus californianus]|uniref:zinc finger protein 721-like n=1 Tax=Mytilus californianus TaxID=6549 RepID=UPI002245FB53|nr:zinc finger protein 721-like [Mytilus californianus]XP_052102202.1 zinc finger protein 721-like [Mytilus californianus]XP_052102203.1 zinc finger protein 721-like [Mytilus californianus]XP_052102205.1 zinc finger protein 721-like [Mytilus californianus]XP_052102206.1 zinc finger protein 721-like [Mytilus californianus]XP_052102207.1 zinc finger protein 721-like [Mytilus californianus]XP_052102208.1 zinc finger protein 721-like [Mytilus californianus]XP_052102209.1 zinc finger protein 721-
MATTRASVNGNKVKTGKIKTVVAKPNLARKTTIKNSIEVKENSKKCKIAVKKPRYSKSKVNTDGEAIVKSMMSADGKLVLETQNNNVKSENKPTKKKNVKNTIFLCEHCATYFKRGYDLDLHIKRVHCSKECDKCQNVFSSFRLLTEHLKFVHGVEPVKFYTKQCTECNRLFDTNTELSEHLAIHTGENLHTCKDCNKKISSKSAFKFHLKICQNADSLKNYECEICQKKFYFKSDLLRHSLTHSGARPHKCQFCDTTFKLRGALVEHVKSLHENYKYPCETCGKIFTAMRNLKRHTETHRPDFEASKPLCTECGKSFRFKSDLEKHKRIHSGEKAFECKICKKSFRLNSHLKQHMVTHTGEKPFKCKFCEKGFSQLANVLCHERKQCKQRLGYHQTQTGECTEVIDDVKTDVDNLKETGKIDKKQKKNNKRKRKSTQKFDIIDWELTSETCSNKEDSGTIKQNKKLVVMEMENEITVISDGEEKTVVANSKKIHSVHIDGCKSVTVPEINSKQIHSVHIDGCKSETVPEINSDETISVSKNKLKNNGDKFSGHNISEGNNGNTSLDKTEDSNHAHTKRQHKYQRPYAARCMGRKANSSVNQKGYIKNDIYEQLMKSCQDKLKSGEVFPFTDPSVDFEKDEDIDVDLVESVPMSDNLMATNSLVFVTETEL